MPRLSNEQYFEVEQLIDKAVKKAIFDERSRMIDKLNYAIDWHEKYLRRTDSEESKRTICIFESLRDMLDPH